jgi:flagellar basal body rod protein FlgG
VASEISTIQSLKAVDAWIDVINANINGGVRTAFKSSRLKFAGSNVDVARAGSSTSLPLQFPEPGLTTGNTLIDFTQGAITASTENTHLAIQGNGFFALASPDMVDTNPASATFGCLIASPTAKFLLTRDGEFRTNQNGLLVSSFGFFPVSLGTGVPLAYDTSGTFGYASPCRAIVNDMDTSGPLPPAPARLSNFIQNPGQNGIIWINDAAGVPSAHGNAILDVTSGKQNLKFSSYGSTVYDIDWKTPVAISVYPNGYNPNLYMVADTQGTILNKSLEASNASMTQSVPELSLAQKLFSALTKVLQTKQTNVDGVLNLVR